MARGGFRPGAGRPKSAAKRTPADKAKRSIVSAAQVVAATDEPTKGAVKKFDTALDFAMAIINDADALMSDKIKLAVAVLPFQHPRLEGMAPGKKDIQASAAREAAKGKFAPPAGPRLAVNNG